MTEPGGVIGWMGSVSRFSARCCPKAGIHGSVQTGEVGCLDAVKGYSGGVVMRHSVEGSVSGI